MEEEGSRSKAWVIQEAQQWESHRVASLLQASIGGPCAGLSAEQQPLRTRIGCVLTRSCSCFAMSPKQKMRE